MTQRQTVAVQQGIWIDRQRLAEAGLDDELEIAVHPGEIRIRSAHADTSCQTEVTDEPLLRLAGVLSGSPLSADEIERELYGDQPAQQ